MAGFHQTIIIGNVGSDVDMRYTPAGQGICNFSVAVNESWTDRTTNEKREKTTWYRVSAWRKLAEVCNQYVKKGMLVQVVGTVEAKAYTNNAGEPTGSLELTARDVLFLSRADDNGVGRDEYGSLERTPQTADDIPF